MLIILVMVVVVAVKTGSVAGNVNESVSNGNKVAETVFGENYGGVRIVDSGDRGG